MCQLVLIRKLNVGSHTVYSVELADSWAVSIAATFQHFTRYEIILVCKTTVQYYMKKEPPWSQTCLTLGSQVGLVNWGTSPTDNVGVDIMWRKVNSTLALALCVLYTCWCTMSRSASKRGGARRYLQNLIKRRKSNCNTTTTQHAVTDQR